MQTLFHSVRLITEECKGCTNCIKHCATEAIRVYQGKALILNELCIDCGECIRVCPNHAKQTVSDSLSIIEDYACKVALLAPSFFGQFSNITVEQLHAAVKAVGFDVVAQVGLGAEHVNLTVKEWMKDKEIRPVISSACPAIVRLIRVRFPELIDNIIPVKAPVEIISELVKESLQKKGYNAHEIGAFFITPCPAKITAIKEPLALKKSAIDGAISFQDVYGLVLNKLSDSKKLEHDSSLLEFSSSQLGMGWGRREGELVNLNGAHVSADGIYNVINLLEEAAVGKLHDIDFLELQACPGGCVGGPLTVQNPFLAKRSLEKLCENISEQPNLKYQEFKKNYQQNKYFWALPLAPLSSMKMNEDISKALSMIKEQEIILKRLPGLDCGACGSPNCEALAADIVRDVASENDCIFLLRESVQNVAQDLWELSKQVPPTIATQSETSSANKDQDEKHEDSGKKTQDEGDVNEAD